MFKKIPIGLTIVLLFLAILITFQITYTSVKTKYQTSIADITETDDLQARLAYIDSLFAENYIGETDGDEVIAKTIAGYFSGSGDKYSYYMSKSEFETYKQSLSQVSGGIGVSIVTGSSKLEIVTVMDGTPAQEAGLKVGDVILAVDGIEIADGATDRLKGDVGTQVTLKIQRTAADGTMTTSDYTITRAEIPTETVSARRSENSQAAIIEILQFTAATPLDFQTKLNEISTGGAPKYLVIDLRSTSGGDSDTALSSIKSLLDLLTPKGETLFKVNQKTGMVTYISESEAVFDTKIAVLVNSATSCGAEIFAASLRDNGIATIVGETTYGKAWRQSVYSLPDGGAAVFSSSEFLPPVSDSFNGCGISPDIVAENTENEEELSVQTDDNDAVLSAALDNLYIQ